MRWCLTARDDLDGRTPADWAAAGKRPERLRHLALKDAARLAQRTG